jgi:small-conductance mechanosensitive channel
MKMKTNTVTLTAPKISAAQRKQLEAHKQNLEQVIRDAESGTEKIRELKEKESSLEKEAASLHREAAQFDRDAEIKLAAAIKQIERVHEAIREEESRAYDDKAVDFRIIDQAQGLVSKICQETYNDLLDQIGSALAPYYRRFDDARYVARGAHAVNDLTVTLLGHRVSAADSIERLFDGATDTLRKVDALLDGSTIWTFQGANGAEKSAAAV